MKQCLKKTLGSSKTTYEEFQTLLVEVEGILNSRPLTYVSEQPTQPLTPSLLCIGRRLLDPVTDNESPVTSSSASDLTRRQKHPNLVIDHFWNRWRREYLTELREHHRGKRESEIRRIKQGDVVCIHENSVPHQN